MNKRRIHPRLLRAEPLRRCSLESCGGACCLFGAWVDRAEKEDILASAALIIPWMPAGRPDPASWFDGQREPDAHALSGETHHTTVLPAPSHYGGTACIFLREDHRCALQVAAQEAGEHPWRYKPFYCILHPLEQDDEGRITLDETQALLDEPASCLRAADKAVPLVETFAPELEYLLGKGPH